MTSSNNLGLDNLRLNNTLLENKIKEGSELITQMLSVHALRWLYLTLLLGPACFISDCLLFNTPTCLLVLLMTAVFPLGLL